MCNRFRVRHKFGVSFLSQCSPELQPAVRACPYCALTQCVPTVRSHGAQVLVVLLLCFPCGKMEQGRQTGSSEAP